MNHTFLFIDPRWVGVPFISITHARVTKQDTQFSAHHRLNVQEPPSGQLQVSLRFPERTTDKQSIPNDIQELNPLYIVILKGHFAEFMRCIRMNDLAFCHRILPGQQNEKGIIATTGLHGMRYQISVTPNQTLAKYEPLLEVFRNLHGPLHTCKITGSEDSHLAASIIQSIEAPIGITEKLPTMWELVSHLL